VWLNQVAKQISPARENLANEQSFSILARHFRNGRHLVERAAERLHQSYLSISLIAGDRPFPDLDRRGFNSFQENKSRDAK
jgi:hypothetical protein